MRRCTLVASLIFLLTCSVAAQHPRTKTVPAATSATQEDILRMFEVMHTREEIQQVMDQAMHQMQAMNREQLKKRRPDITEAELDRMEHESAEIMKGFPVADLMRDMVPVYQKHLSKADVKALISFYSTATGQKLLREMPALTSEAMQAAYPRIQQHLEDTFQRIDRRNEEQQKKGETPPSEPGKN